MIDFADGNNGNYWHTAAVVPMPQLFINSTSPSLSITEQGDILLSWVNKENGEFAGFVEGTVESGGRAIKWQPQTYVLQNGKVTAISTAILPGNKLVEFWTDDQYHLFYRFGTLSVSKIDWNSQATEVTQPETLTNVVEPKVKWVGEQNGKPLLAVMWRDDAHNKIGLSYATIIGTGVNTQLSFPTQQSFSNLVYSPALAFSTIGSSTYSIIGGAAKQNTTVKTSINKASTTTTYPYQVASGPLTMNNWPESLASIATYLRTQQGG